MILPLLVTDCRENFHLIYCVFYIEQHYHGCFVVVGSCGQFLLLVFVSPRVIYLPSLTEYATTPNLGRAKKGRQ